MIALLTVDEVGAITFPRDEEGSQYVVFLPGFDMTPQELTAVILEIKSHRRFWNVSSFTLEAITVTLPADVPSRALSYEVDSVLLDCVDAIDKLHCRPSVNSNGNNAATRTHRTEDDITLERWLRTGENHTTRKIRDWLSSPAR